MISYLPSGCFITRILQFLHSYCFTGGSWLMDPFNQTIIEPHKGQPIVIMNMKLMSFIIISMLNNVVRVLRSLHILNTRPSRLIYHLLYLDKLSCKTLDFLLHLSHFPICMPSSYPYHENFHKKYLRLAAEKLNLTV